MSIHVGGRGPGHLARVSGMPQILYAGDNGFAIDFVRGQIQIRDTNTPANEYNGVIPGKAGVTGTLLSGTDGTYIDTSNFLRLAYTAWPYDKNNITIAGEIKFDTNTDASLRSIFQIDAGGDDRLYVVSLAGSDDVTLSIGTGAGASNVGSPGSAIVAGTWLEFVAVAGPLGAFLAIDGVVVTTSTTIVNAHAAPVAQSGIGASPATTAGAANSSPMKGNMRSLRVLSRAVSQEVAKAGGILGMSIACIGDSLTHGVVATVTQDEAFPALLADRLGRIVYAYNLGDQGDTTGEMMARRSMLGTDGTPDIVTIYGGTNDVSNVFEVQASPSPTDTVFTVTAGEGTHFGDDGWITVGAEQAQISTVVGDVITLTAPLAGGAPAAGTLVANDTEKNLTEIANYAQTIGCNKVLILGTHYWNWTSGGDTTSVELARNATLRGYQQAAATASGSVYVDLYEWMRQLILDGAYEQGDNGWHSSTNNQHLNEAGQSILADAIESAIKAQGWV